MVTMSSTTVLIIKIKSYHLLSILIKFTHIYLISLIQKKETKTTFKTQLTLKLMFKLLKDVDEEREIF